MPSQQLAAKYGHIRFLPCPGRTEILSKFRAISGIVCKTRSPTLPKSAKVKLSSTLANFRNGGRAECPRIWGYVGFLVGPGRARDRAKIPVDIRNACKMGVSTRSKLAKVQLSCAPINAWNHQRRAEKLNFLLHLANMLAPGG